MKIVKEHIIDEAFIPVKSYPFKIFNTSSKGQPVIRFIEKFEISHRRLTYEYWVGENKITIETLNTWPKTIATNILDFDMAEEFILANYKKRKKNELDEAFIPTKNEFPFKILYDKQQKSYYFYKWDDTSFTPIYTYNGNTGSWFVFKGAGFSHAPGFYYNKPLGFSVRCVKDN